MTPNNPDNIPPPSDTSGVTLGGGSTVQPSYDPLGGDDLHPPSLPDQGSENFPDGGPDAPAHPGVDPDPVAPRDGPKLEDDEGKTRDAFVGTHQIGGDQA